MLSSQRPPYCGLACGLHWEQGERLLPVRGAAVHLGPGLRVCLAGPEGQGEEGEQGLDLRQETRREILVFA